MLALTVEFGRSVLRGVGQVMFQNNARTGALFLLGILAASPAMATAALVGSLTGTITALVWRFDRQEIRDGIYGFNSTLVGVALLFFDEQAVLTWALALLGSVAASIVTWYARKYVPFPTYTAPFVVTTWLVLAVAGPLGVFSGPPAAGDVESSAFRGVTEGVSQVMFQASPLTGMLFLLGIAISAPKHAAWALFGSALGMLIAIWHSDPQGAVSSGIYGYNAALAAMALWIYRPSFVFPLLAILLSVPVTEGFPRFGLETLTAPFVLASWLTIAIAQIDDLFRGDGDRAG